MSQKEILNVLEKSNGLGMTSREIACELKTERNKIAPYLTRLLHNKLVRKEGRKIGIYYII